LLLCFLYDKLVGAIHCNKKSSTFESQTIYLFTFKDELLVTSLLDKKNQKHFINNNKCIHKLIRLSVNELNMIVPIIIREHTSTLCYIVIEIQNVYLIIVETIRHSFVAQLKVKDPM
jgi:hypothetical protein